MKPTATAIALSSLLVITNALAGPKGESYERDRAAILAMAGEFEVEFNFKETVPLKEGYELKEAYHEDADEIVFLVEDSPGRIVLQHVLWVDTHDRVVKHWKQEWRYEDRVMYEFVGDNTWERRELEEEEAKGTWTQSVSQVDDSPRYESFGRWVHEGGASSWLGSKTRRPLPRREYTKRKDYDTMVAVNRQTLTPYGWVHEQDNLKRVSEDGEALCREVGLNKYFRTSEGNFEKVKEYWASTNEYWGAVSKLWQAELEGGMEMALRSELDGKPLFRHLFGIAKEDGLELDARVEKARKVIDGFVIRSEQAASE